MLKSFMDYLSTNSDILKIHKLKKIVSTTKYVSIIFNIHL